MVIIKLSNTTINLYRNPILVSFDKDDGIRVKYERINKINTRFIRIVAEEN